MRNRALALTASIATLCVGCSDVFGNKDPHAPGDPVGLYKITADVDASSTCAEAAAAAPRPWIFEVTLRRDKSNGYWVASDEPIVGTIDDKGAIAFHSVTRVTVHGPDKVKQVGTCIIDRTDDFTGTLAGEPSTSDGVKSFSGTLRYGYTVEPGSDCSDVVGPVTEDRKSPIFSTMPCDVRFKVNAARIGDAKPR